MKTQEGNQLKLPSAHSGYTDMMAAAGGSFKGGKQS